MLIFGRDNPAYLLVMPSRSAEKTSRVLDTITLAEQTEYVRILLEKNLEPDPEEDDRGVSAWKNHLPALAIAGGFYAVELARRGLDDVDVEWFYTTAKKVTADYPEDKGLPEWLNDEYLSQSRNLLHRVAPDYYTEEMFANL